MRALSAHPLRASCVHRAALAAGILLLAALPVLGTAAVAGAVSAPQLTTPTTSSNLGSVSLGLVNQNPGIVTLTNSGQAVDTVTGFTLGGANPLDFFVFLVNNPDDSNTCTIDQNTGAGTIQANGTCDLLLGFNPGAVGPRSATITVKDGSAVPLTIAVQGIGTEGYYETTSNGAVRPFGDAQSFGDISQSRIKAPVVAVTQTGDGQGYWLLAADGGIFAFGDAPFYGSTGSLVLNKPIVGMAQTADGGGYWLVASDGGIFSFGDAPFLGSTGAIRLNQPIVGMAETSDGNGYWLVASDGGIFTFGNAAYYGSTGGIVLNKPIVGMAVTPDGGGYWLVASDGGIFTFGDAQFYGSTGAIHLNQPIVGMAATPDGAGYWLVASDGGIFAFGTAQFYGSIGGTGVTDAVGMADSGSPTLQAILDVPALRTHQAARFKAAWAGRLSR